MSGASPATSPSQDGWDAHADWGFLSPACAGTPALALTSDAAFVQALLDVEAAWAQTLAQAGLASRAQAEQVRERAAVRNVDAARLAEHVQLGGNVLIPLLGELRRLAPEAAPVIHHSLTSQDVIDTALMLMTRAVLRDAAAQLGPAIRALLAEAERHGHTPIMARTLSQPALPSTLGLRIANWASPLAQAAGQLRRLAEELPLQLGGAAGTLAGLANPFVLLEDLAERLDLRRPATPWHTDRTEILRIAGALGQSVAAAGKLAQDVLAEARATNPLYREHGSEGHGASSSMAHKHNPVHAVLLNSVSLSAPAYVSQLFLAAGMQREERADGAWHAEWHALRELLRSAGAAAYHVRALAESLRFEPGPANRDLEPNHAEPNYPDFDTGLAEQLTEQLVAQCRAWLEEPAPSEEH